VVVLDDEQLLFCFEHSNNLFVGLIHDSGNLPSGRYLHCARDNPNESGIHRNKHKAAVFILLLLSLVFFVASPVS